MGFQAQILLTELSPGSFFEVQLFLITAKYFVPKVSVTECVDVCGISCQVFAENSWSCRVEKSPAFVRQFSNFGLETKQEWLKPVSN